MATNRMSALIIATIIPIMAILLTLCSVAAWFENMFKHKPTTKVGEMLKLRCPTAGEYKIGDSWADTH